MAMITGYIRVPAPATTRPKGGLFSAAEVIDLSANEVHQLMGVEYESSACFPTRFVTLDPDSCLATEEKEFDGVGWEQGLPFHIYAGAQCGLFPKDDYEAKVLARLEDGEERAAEEHLWTSTLRERAVNLTPDSGAVSLVAALGILEEYAGTIYGSTPLVHVGRRLAAALAAKGLIKGGETVSAQFPVVNGAGYTSPNGPDDEGTPADDNGTPEDPEDDIPAVPPAPIVAGEGEAWMYISGAVVLRRGPTRSFTAVDPENNESVALAERTYVPTVDCMVGAILVTLE